MMWQEFLEQQGFQAEGGELRACPPVWENQAMQQGFVTSLGDLGLIRVSGVDAASFLHKQLSNDVEHLGAGQVRRAAWCTPKGRMLASIVYWKNDDAIYLQLSGSVQAAALKRLRMFVLRDKAVLTDASAEYATLGLGGAAAGALLTKWFAQLPAQAGQIVHNAAGSLMRVPDAGTAPRYQWVAPVDVASAAWPELTQALQTLNTSAWRLGDIMAGIPQIIAATQEKFVPQMVNFELIGGVNFKKGCYPGQEIVARSQYLGKLKRRMAIAAIASTAVSAGMDIYAAADPAQPCGTVVNAEPDSATSSLALVEIKLADLEGCEICLGAADGCPLRFLPLPYEIVDITQ